MNKRKEQVEAVAFHELPLSLLCKLPWELWLIVKKYTVLFTLQHSLQFPTLICKRRNHLFYADYWQAHMRHHRWDIESSGSTMSSLIGQSFRDRRISLRWAGLAMTIGERLFGNGMPTSAFFEELFRVDDLSSFGSSLDEEGAEFEDEVDVALFQDLYELL
jgi:hypothetical protein